MFEFETNLEHEPKRSDPIYMEIESFESYELLTCVIYEAAIRDPYVKKLLDQYNTEIKKLLTESTEGQIDEKTYKSELESLYQTSLLAEEGFSKDACQFFVDKHNNSHIKLKNYLSSFPNRYEESRHGDIVELIKNDDGSITRKYLNIERVTFEYGLQLEEYFKQSEGCTEERSQEILFKVTNRPIAYKDSEYQDFLQALNSNSIDGNKILSLVMNHIDDDMKSILDYKAIKRTKNWSEFDSAPIFNLKLAMPRPILKNKLMHKHLSVTFNFNLPLEELQEQLKSYKSCYDNNTKSNKEISEKSSAQVRERLPSGLKLITMPSLKENLLTAGELGCINSTVEIYGNGRAVDYIVDFFKKYEQIKTKKHDASKNYADMFFIYDYFECVDQYNQALEKERDNFIKEIKLMGLEDEEDTIKDLESDYALKVIRKPEFSLYLYEKIKDKKTEKRGKKVKINKHKSATKSSLVYRHLKESDKLIKQKMYKALM